MLKYTHSRHCSSQCRSYKAASLHARKMGSLSSRQRAQHYTPRTSSSSLAALHPHTTPPHLTVVSSGSHMNHPINAPKWPQSNILHFFNQPENFVGFTQNYNVSKLLLQYAMREVAPLAVVDGKFVPPLSTVSSLVFSSSPFPPSSSPHIFSTATSKLQLTSRRPSPITNTACPGLIGTNLIREFKAQSPIHTLFARIHLFLTANPVSYGARALILATLVPPSEHGIFRAPYVAPKDYAAYVTSSSSYFFLHFLMIAWLYLY